MFEDRDLLMWTPLAQRNALRALFMTPVEANDLAERAQAVATANSAYRNLLYIFNRDKKKLEKAKEELAGADALSAEYHTLQRGIAALNETQDALKAQRDKTEQLWSEARSVAEAAKFNYDDVVREMEALKLARVASAFPNAEQSSRYVLSRLIGDKECLACGAEDGPLIERWVAAVAEGSCLLCGAGEPDQEAIVPPTVVDTARLTRLDERLGKARQALETSLADEMAHAQSRSQLQRQLDQIAQERAPLENRVQQIAGSVPPSPPEVATLEERVKKQSATLEQLKIEQTDAERMFAEIFGRFSASVEQKADAIRQRFGEKITEFLVERAEISLAFKREPIGESGQSFDWPTFNLSMTSGTFDAPAPRLNRTDVSMSQGAVIDLAVRLALVGVAAEDGPAPMIFDAPEASLDALFMRRAGAFLSRFTEANPESRLIVTSNLTNADMIPALFGAYKPLDGDPLPRPIPRDERRARVIDLLELAAPTSAVELVGERYKNLLDEALFPPNCQAAPGL
jgi:peptidoglycan hydrolase CwlO-like protein